MSARITQLLEQGRNGDAAAHEQAMELLYAELRGIARAHLRAERRSHTLQPTALVHEAYARLFGDGAPQLNNRSHFLAAMSVVMRRVLVDYARSRNSLRRGGERLRVTFRASFPSAGPSDAIELLELDAALDALAREKPVMGRYVEMHYYGGMTAEEIAAATEHSVHVVRQRLRFAQAWLRRQLDQGGTGQAAP